MQHAPVLAFFPRPEGGTAPLQREWVEASDWFVLFTLGTLLFLLGSFAAWAWLIWRRTTRPKPHMRLLMELENDNEAAENNDTAATGRDERTTPQGEKPAPAAPWEQPADWWRKTDG
ncbi:MAG: hypothetical protein ACO1TE_03730 [Prosthecobacter sp.]